MTTTLNLIRRMTIEAKTVGVAEATRAVERFAATQDKAAAAAGRMGVAQESATTSTLSAARQFSALERRLDPVARAQQNLARESGVVTRALNEGAITTAQADRAMLMLNQRHQAAVPAIAGATRAIALNRYQMQNLAFQLNDVSTMLLMGASPFQIMASQGGQVTQILQSANGGVSGALKDIGGRFLGLLTPARLAGGAIAGIAVAGAAAWNSWDNQLQALTRSLNGVGRASGLTVNGLADIAQRGAAAGNLSLSQATSSAGAFAGAGLGGQTISGLLGGLDRYSRAFGVGLDDATTEFTKALRSPTEGLKVFEQRFGTFGAVFADQIRMLEGTGQAEAARTLLMRRFSDELAKTTDASSRTGKIFDSAWNWASNAFGSSGKALNEAFNAGDFAQQVRDAASALALFESSALRTSGLVGGGGARQRGLLTNELGAAQERQLWDTGAQLERARAAVVEQQRIRDEASAKIRTRLEEDTRLAVQSVSARTAAERLGVEIQKVRIDALRDEATAMTEGLQIARARAVAGAESNRMLQDAGRRASDEVALAGLKPFDRQMRQIQFEMRDLREQTLGGANNPAISAIGGQRAAALTTETFNTPFARVAEEIKQMDQRTRDAANSFGRGAGALAELTKRRELEAMVMGQTSNVTADMQKRMDALAKSFGEAAQRSEDVRLAQQRVVESMDFLRNSTSGFLGTFVSGVMDGRRAVDSLRDATRGMADQLAQRSINQLVGGVLGQPGTPGGGLFGDALGKFLGTTTTNAAMMNVQATSVNVIGGAGAGGMGGGLLGMIASAFGFGGAGAGAGIGGLYANGAAFSGGRVTPFARGGVVNGPTIFPMANGAGLMGEAGPEAVMPLRRGSDGRLGVSAARPANNNAQSRGSGGGVSITVNNHSQAQVETRQSRGPDGKQQLEFMITEVVKKNYASGGFDDVNRARFGKAPRGVAR